MPRFAPYGFVRGVLSVPIDLLTGTSAREFLTDFVPGFQGTIESVTYVVKIAHTGSNAVQTIRLLKGASTVIASEDVEVADTGTSGGTVDLPVTAANADFEDDDELSVDMTAGGTAFTAGTGQLLIRYRQRPQRAA